MEESYYDINEVLNALDPCDIQYQDFIIVGMALKDAGYPFSMWEDWARRDTERYKGNGNMERKWEGFGHNAGESATLGSIVQLARDNGWEPSYEIGYALSWDDDITNDRPDGQIIDPSWVEAKEIIEPDSATWEGWKEVVTYLETLFAEDEYVGYVVNSWQDEDGKWKPGRRGDYRRTAGEIIDSVKKYKNDLDSSLGHYEPLAGAWIRFNPLDGKGVRNDNVAEFRYALVESDTVDIERQRAIIEQLELPVAALVYSGSKSIHAIVKIDAKDYDEYRKRVDFLYKTCAKNGLKVDTQNKNPSRLSRMPGVVRGDKKQFLIATNIGKESWTEWRTWLDEINDDLPEPESLADYWNNLPDLADPLIDGILRQGHKMLLAGPSKAGKSFSLIELCIAIAEGKKWMGWQCAQGRVLYVNLELDSASCLHRFKDAYKAAGITPTSLSNIDIWNLRGKSKPMDKLAPSLIRRALKTRPIAVVIDPIYKVITGDENSADQMATFCNQFDKICNELGCAVIYCHHHSKGNQGSKRSMDRASGSGVFARDPDALLDLIELELTEDIQKQQEDNFVRVACEFFLDNLSGMKYWRKQCPEDTQLVGEQLRDWCRGALERDQYNWLLEKVYAARVRAKAQSAWRIEGTLREFPKFDPVNVWFDYPIHRIDDIGVLKDIDTDQAVIQRQRAKGKERKTKSDREKKANLVREAFNQCQIDKVAPTRKNVYERLGELGGKPVSENTFKEWTRGGRNEWCPIKIDPEKANEGVLVDVEMQSLLEGF